jgi:predicted alpha/beta hydrolase
MLAGHSWGGYAVCAVLNYNHRINAVVSFAGYNKCADVFNEQGELMVGGIFYTLTPQFWAIEKQLFGDTAKLTAVEGINNAGIPVMIVQCANDEAIPAATTSIYAHRGEIRNPHARIVYREGADATGHEYVFCSPAQKVYMDSLIESWQAYKAAHENPSQQQWADEISFDKYRANELDAELMKSINDLFNSSK